MNEYTEDEIRMEGLIEKEIEADIQSYIDQGVHTELLRESRVVDAVSFLKSVINK